MSKRKNDQDETPIQFEIPSVGTRLRKRVPIPINQPHWVYRKNSSRDILSALIPVMILAGIIIVAFYKPTEGSNTWLYKTIIGIGFLVIVYILIQMWNRSRTINEDTRHENTSKESKKKIHKKRKDYK